MGSDCCAMAAVGSEGVALRLQVCIGSVTADTWPALLPSGQGGAAIAILWLIYGWYCASAHHSQAGCGDVLAMGFGGPVWGCIKSGRVLSQLPAHGP